MKNRLHAVHNERGSVINVALLILILIFLIGIGLNKISTTDIKIASNMKTEATTFYGAEAGLEGISELLELNVACPTGFSNTADIPAPDDEWEKIRGRFIITNRQFWREESAGDPTGNPKTNPDIVAYYIEDPTKAYVPYVDEDGETWPFDPNEPHTSFSVGGPTRFSRGSAIQMAAGYEGMGKGAAAGGASIIYDIFSMRYGENDSEAQNMIQWIHLLGLGGACSY